MNNATNELFIRQMMNGVLLLRLIFFIIITISALQSPLVITQGVSSSSIVIPTSVHNKHYSF